jgi:D-psicose/D-tagatose/L-ribulose 3-epimerase
MELRRANMKNRFFIISMFVLNATHVFAGDSSRVRVLQNLFILDANMANIQVSDLEKLVKRGAEGFELPGTVSTIGDARRLAPYIKSHHLPVGLNVAVDPQRDPSSTDPFIRKAGIDYLKSRIDIAYELGASVMAGPIALPWGGFYDTSSTTELQNVILAPKIQNAAARLREVAGYAEEKGIKLALEPLHRHEMHGLNTMEEAAAFVKEVNHPNFGICLDSSHEVIDGAGPEVYSRLVHDLHARGFFIYAQVSAPSRGDVKNSWIPWGNYLGLLKSVGVTSVTVEIMQAKPPFSARNGGGIRLSRLPFDDPFQVVEDAISKTRAEWSRLASEPTGQSPSLSSQYFDFNAGYKMNDPDYDKRQEPQQVHLNSGYTMNNPSYGQPCVQHLLLELIKRLRR